MTTSQRFDLPALRAICRDWPNGAIAEQTLEDGLLERLRQTLIALQQGTATRSADILPLIRQLLLRQADDGAEPGWLSVPLAPGWPDKEDWCNGNFRIDPSGDRLNVSPNFPRLNFIGEQADLFDDAFRESIARPLGHVPGDPLLRRSLRLPTYTGNGQREALRALLHLPPGETLIANLPTGSGKSLLAQLPPMLNPEGFLTLVIVPTVALALDQERRMQALLAQRFPHRDPSPLAYHGGLSQENRVRVREAIRAGTQHVLFTSPESATGSLRKCLEEAAAERRLSQVVIDEAHLVTGWGNGFRPVFQLLPALVRDLRERSADKPIRVVLASATLSSSTLTALRQFFGPPLSTYLVSAVHLRSEPRYAFQYTEHQSEQTDRILEAIRFAPRPFILYVTRPDEAIRWLKQLREEGYTRIAAFTGQTRADDREALLRAWAANELDGMVATSAFGLGVDKNDVRAVFHATLPESLDRFYQEVGRGGRDGRASASLLIHTLSDAEQAKSMAKEKILRNETAMERWYLMIDHAKPGEGGVFWLDLTLVPAHLRIGSERNSQWNLRTLTLMARAGLVELVALRDQEDGDTPLDLALASRAAVRILEPDHRDPEVFAQRVSRAREEMIEAGEQGILAMQHVANLKIEISEALASTYSITQRGVWSPVVRCCGGCATHWRTRRLSEAYSPPDPGRLGRFASRDTSRIRNLQLPMASPRMLLISAPEDGRKFINLCERLAGQLASVLRPHTWQMERSMGDAFARNLEKLLMKQPNDDSFVDIIDSDAPDAWAAGDGEVRVIFLDRVRPAAFPTQLWHSSAALDIVVVPNTIGDPHAEWRFLTDTVPHVPALAFIDKISS